MDQICHEFKAGEMVGVEEGEEEEGGRVYGGVVVGGQTQADEAGESSMRVDACVGAGGGGGGGAREAASGVSAGSMHGAQRRHPTGVYPWGLPSQVSIIALLVDVCRRMLTYADLC